jgi:hypothetical protein
MIVNLNIAALHLYRIGAGPTLLNQYKFPLLKSKLKNTKHQNGIK